MTAPWREAQAAALDAMADAIAAALAELDVAEVVLEERGRDRVVSEVRATAASLRAEQNEMRAQARALRTTPAAAGGFPISATARFPRAAATADDPKELSP